MSNPNKYFVELSLECVLETNEDEKEIVIEKLNRAISKIIKDQNAVHMNISLNLISESSIMASFSAFGEGLEN